MSLNGLEAPEVNEAYQSALGEGGGWFLLKYTSRDEVCLLGKGSGGLEEVQEAVELYPEQSPLFGFIHYRRRKVLLKYVPGGTSRLLQARVTVHFQFVTDKLAPHDAIFSFTKPEELQDSTLSSVCSLHTATASLKSSNDSMRQPGLAGISEDVSEFRTDHVQEQGNAEKSQRMSLSRQTSEGSQTRPEEVKENANAKHVHQKSLSGTTNMSLKRARTVSNVDKALPPIPGDVTGVSVKEGPSNDQDPPRSIPNHNDYETRLSVEGRLSSQSARPSTRDLYDAHGFKPKIKLGPRPSTDSVGRSDKMDRNDFRPIATLPTGLRIPIRKPAPQNLEPARPQSQQSQRTFLGSPSHREKPQMTPITPLQISDRRAPVMRNGLLTPAKTPAEPNSSTITPEKQRLMKALQLRQKQLAAQRSAENLRIQHIPAQNNNAKPDIDDSILEAITDVSNPETDPDLVRVAVKDVSREDTRNLESSPISIPETSDGPSTQASSITEEEVEMENIQGDSTKEAGAPSNTEDVLPDFADEDTLRGSREGSKTDSYHIHQENDRSVSLPLVVDHGAMMWSEQSVMEASEGSDKPFLGATALQKEQEQPISMLSAPNENLTTSLLPRKETATSDLGDPQSDTLATSSRPHAMGLQISESKAIDQATVTIDEKEASSSDSPCAHITDMPVGGPEKESKIPGTSQRLSSPDSCLALDRDTPASHAASKAVEQRPQLDVHIHRAGESVHSQELSVSLVDGDRHMNSDFDEAITKSQSTRDSSTTKVAFQPSLNHSTGQPHGDNLTATELSMPNVITDQQESLPNQRHDNLHPLKRLSSPEHSDEHFLSDDSFMEELKSATVQEAKPISVSKSPIKPVFSRTDSDQCSTDTMRATRTVSSPLDRPARDEKVSPLSHLPTPPSSRSFSASHPLRPENKQKPAPLPKKIGVSSGISQRIKALEQLSSRPTSPQSAPPSGTSTFITQRKTSLRSPRETPDRNAIPMNKSRPNSAYPSPSPSPEAIKTDPFNNLNLSGTSRPESISVTATIVRGVRQKTPETTLNASEPRPLDLQKSPLKVETQNMAPPPRPLSPLKPPRPRYARYSSARSGSSSSTEAKAETPQFTRRDSFASILSRSSRAGSEAELPRTLSDSSLNGLASRDENREDKKDSKRSRLMKRMSSISSMSRRSIANALSPSPKEHSIVERHESIAEAPADIIDVGDVNIQFPDTLLWKRRHMVIDENGVLVLSPSKSDNNLKVTTKKFPLSGFRSPYIPDQDRQELPNSVILDFKDGSTLQCACEHPQGQADVLQTLRNAHSIHQSQ